MINLDKLPEVLKQQRDNNTFDENLVVDMGKVLPEKNQLLFTPILVAFILMITSSLAIFYTLKNENRTVTVVLKEKNDDPHEILIENGIKDYELEQTSEGFVVRLGRMENFKLFLEKMRQEKNVESIKIQE